MRDELLIVQFPHRRDEHGPEADSIKQWNTRPHHARKFMTLGGQWLEGADVSGELVSGPIVFWGEWEPQSLIVDTFRPQSPGWPRYLDAPFWIAPQDPKWRQNTDPFVFGDQFLYSNCFQNSKTGPRKTQRLARGSVILFGSTLEGEFILDTVFVVANAQPMALHLLSELEGVDETFVAVVGDVLYRKASDRDSHQRLYSGARPSRPVHGMFSFFPCLPRDKALHGFARPSIRIPGVVNPQSSRNIKFTPAVSLDDAYAVWRQVVDQVLEQDLLLGVHAEMPPRVQDEFEARSLLGK